MKNMDQMVEEYRAERKARKSQFRKSKKTIKSLKEMWQDKVNWM
jgi:hypothetical protein